LIKSAERTCSAINPLEGLRLCALTDSLDRVDLKLLYEDGDERGPGILSVPIGLAEIQGALRQAVETRSQRPV